MIRFIIFDLSEVLLTGVKDYGERLAKKHDLINKGISSPFLIPSVEKFFHGNISEDSYLSEVLKEYPELENLAELKKQIRYNFVEINGVRDIIIQLKSLGYKLTLLSVHGKEWVNYCNEQFDHHKLFDTISYSFDNKVSKPNSDAFIITLKKMGTKPEECLFIDDSLVNIRSAESLGIKSVQFFNSNDLEIKLKGLLLNY